MTARPSNTDRWPAKRLRGFDYSDTTHAYFVTVRARPGMSPFAKPSLAAIVVDSIHWLRANRGLIVYAYCLMPDHLHLLIRLGPDGSTSVERIMRRFKSFTTHQSWKHGVKGQLWQQRFYDHVVRGFKDIGAPAEHIRQNPVRAGLVSDPEA